MKLPIRSLCPLLELSIAFDGPLPRDWLIFERAWYVLFPIELIINREGYLAQGNWFRYLYAHKRIQLCFLTWTTITRSTFGVRILVEKCFWKPINLWRMSLRLTCLWDLSSEWCTSSYKGGGWSVLFSNRTKSCHDKIAANFNYTSPVLNAHLLSNNVGPITIILMSIDIDES